MKKNSKTIAKYFLYYCMVFLIFLGIQFLFFDTTVSNPFTTLTESYNIGESLTETEALNIINTEGVDSIVESNDMYILKTPEGNYYQTPVSETITLGLKLEGAIIEESVENTGSGLSVFWILAGALVATFILRSVMSMLTERRMADTFSEAFSSAMHGDLNELHRSNQSSKKEESKEEAEKIKKITFADVQGIDELKPDLYRLVDCLKNPKKYEELGARMPKGMVLYGPPGTGKTLTAKALAGESGVPFLSICGSDFVEKYVGVGASRVRELYKKARSCAPCIVFIDEIDAIGGGRGDSNNSEKDQTINALLAELDGFKGSDNVLTICATNRLDILDPALLRAGRFDLKLAVGLPDREGREAILKLHSKNKKLNETVSIPALAKKTIGFSGAELENLLNESALTAAANDKKFIDNEDIENAFFKIIMDGNKKPRKEVDEDTYLTAWHEAGHTLATKLLTKDGVPTVTIIQSTSGAGGVTFMAPDEKNLPSKKYLRNKIKVDYAGRAAEEIYLGNSDDITTGASQDIKQATAVIKSYIGAYGMGSKGLIDIKQLTAQYDIVEEAAELSNMLYQETLELLRANEDKLRALADALIAKETLYEDEIDEILGIIKLDKTEKVESVETVVEEVAVEEVQEEPVEMESEKTDTEAVLIEE